MQWFATLPETVPASGVAPLTAGHWQRDRPDLHGWLSTGGRLQGRCSLWWRQTPSLDGDRLGYIGHWAAEPAIAVELLDQACAVLQQQGCQRAIAPIDGSTWSDYRALVAPETGRPFFAEPACPPASPFEQAGFQPLAAYQSSLCTDLTQRDLRLERVATRLRAQGVQWRALTATEVDSPEAFRDLLQRLYPLIQQRFRANLLFVPLAWPDFLARYQPLRPYLRPELCWLATDGDRALGCLLALPDYSQGDRPDTLVVKTLVAAAERRYAGLGALLLQTAQQAAAQQGYRQAIHALMQVANPSRALSDRYAQPWRHYQLFAKPLAATPDET